MIQGIIYCAISPSGEKYYGQTTKNLQKRIRGHCGQRSLNDNTIFHNSLKKYGSDSFSWNIIEIISEEDENILKNKLNEREKYWIERDKTYIYKYGKEFGYNMSLGGEGRDYNSGRKWSDETKKKMSNSRRGKKFTEEHRLNLSLSIKSAKDNASEDEKKKRHEYAVGEKSHFFGKPAWNKNRKNCYSEETLEAMRNNTKLAMQKPEVRKKYEENRPDFSGEKNGMWQKNHSETSKKQMGIKLREVEKIYCHHCLKNYYPWHYSRSHGDKCKMKDN